MGKVVAAIAGLVLAVALAVSALHAYANSNPSHNGSASAQDTTFLQTAQQYNLAEQTFGQIAQDRAQSGGITQLATTTLNDHRNAQTKVASLAADLGVNLPTTLSSVQQAQADQLKSIASSSFDLAYAENQVGGHQQSIASAQQEINHGSNSSVISYAKSFLSLEQSHLSEAQAQVNANSGGGSGSTSEGQSSGGSGSSGTGAGNSPTAVPAGTGGSAAMTPAKLRARLNAPSRAQDGSRLASPAATHGAEAGTGPPMVIALPSIGVTAWVAPVGVSRGNLQVPDIPTQVGWWVRSAEAGTKTGSVIIDGHVDTERGGLGALYRMGIGDLRIGDRIIATTMFGRQVSYRIYAQNLYPKTPGLPAEVLSQSREPRLVLITCGGRFDVNDRNYEDNVVVYARPSND